MRHVAHRIGPRIPRGWVILILVIGSLVATAFWIGPFRPLPPELTLSALSGDGQFREIANIPTSWADTAPLQPGVLARFPLVLAVHNRGARAALPLRLALSIPGTFRVANTAGQPYDGRGSIGNPLVRYVFEIQPGRIAPGQVPRVLSTLDTLWLEPVLPSYYCTVLGDSVPEFMSAPPHDAEALSRVRIFYSFDARVRDRQTGLLTIQVEPRLLERAPAPTPPVFPARVQIPKYPMPEMLDLHRIGDRTTQCGDPASPIELQSVLWETGARGRFFVLYNGTVPRKYLFDLNRDSIVELEMWDQDGDGDFEAARPARMLIPEFLMPPRAALAAADVAAGDSTGVGFSYSPTLFSATDAGPLRFWQERASATDSTRASQVPATPADSTGAPDTTRVIPAPVAAPSSTQPQFRFSTELFHESGAGPLRFWRAQRRAAGDTSVAVREPRRNTGPRLLGVPVPLPPPRRDTMR